MMALLFLLGLSLCGFLFVLAAVMDASESE